MASSAWMQPHNLLYVQNNMDRRIVGDSTHRVLVCHSNRSLVRLAQVNAARHGLQVDVAKNGKDLLLQARGEVRPDAVILSTDLKDPSTDEIVKILNADPFLKGVPVIVAKGILGNFAELLKSMKRPPWMVSL